MTDKIPISQILVEDRLRLDIHNNDNLKESLAERGTIQPILLVPTISDKYTHRLVAGGRRLHHLIELGHTHLYHGSVLDPSKPGYVLATEQSKDDLFLVELEENFKRSDMTWQEKVLGIATYHETLSTKAALAGKEKWGQFATGQLLGVDRSHISYTLQVARLLRAELGPDNKPLPTARFWLCENMYGAWQLHLRDKLDEARALAIAKATENSSIISVDEEIPYPLEEPLSLEEVDLARQRYESNPLNTMPYEDYLKARAEMQQEVRQTVNLSAILKQGDSIEFMHSNPGRFDHVITDIPYAIDMKNLNQQNIHGGFENLDQVEELHDVSYNMKLIADFFPAAYVCTKEKAFVITWCDQMLWQYMYDHAVKAGFSVQRWPITWVKTSSCMNQCVNFNTTKDTEIAIVCRKKGSTLVNQPQTSVITASRLDDITTEMDHPFAKPFACWEFLTKMVSYETQSILEPFAGRGSGVISMLRMNRAVVGVELDKTHHSALVENVKRLHYLPLNPNFNFK